MRLRLSIAYPAAPHWGNLMQKKLIKKNVLPSILALSLTFCAGLALADIEADLMSEFSALEKSGGADGQAWFGLAQKARSAEALDIADRALERAATAGVSPLQIGIEKSRQLVVADESAMAVAELRGLMDQGFTSVAVLTGDPVINSLAGDPGYDALIGEMRKVAYPCAYREGFSDFDFWIGDWDVHVANGTKAGTNSITREERGCVLIERWENVAGGTGMSVNFLDGITNEWVQVWNAEGGSQINIRGGLTDDGMAMEGTLHNVATGTTVPFRALWTLLPDGRVRQYFEQSNDGGETWVPWFEGFYTRQAK
jgi:hypothetical protein